MISIGLSQWRGWTVWDNREIVARFSTGLDAHKSCINTGHVSPDTGRKLQDGTNCRSCRMTARTCRDHEPGEVGAVCCDQCNHPNAVGNECVSECLCEEVSEP